MVNDFFYKQPVKLWFGAGMLGRLGEILSELGCEKCVIACGRHFAPEAEALKARFPAIAGVYGEVEHDPHLARIEEMVRLARACGADTVIGIGGGSCIDTAKFAAATAPGGGEILSYYNGELPFAEKPLRIIAVPTTAGTGSEVTQVAVVNHYDEKKTINDPAFMPTAAVLDPELTLTVPPRTTMITGLDALSHALEGYWCVHHQPINNLFAIKAVHLILDNLEAAYRDGSDLEARSNMLYGSLLAGLAFSTPRTAGCHACSYPLSEMFHMPHGEACAFTLDSFVRINADARLERLCHVSGLWDTDELAKRIANLKKLGGLRTRFSELGEFDMDSLCRACAGHVLMRNNPVAMDTERLREMFEALR